MQIIVLVARSPMIVNGRKQLGLGLIITTEVPQH